MSKRKIAIKSTSLPVPSPVLGVITLWLLMDRLGAPMWAYGVLGTFAALWLFAFIYDCCTRTERDVPGFGARDV